MKSERGMFAVAVIGLIVTLTPVDCKSKLEDIGKHENLWLMDGLHLKSCGKHGWSNMPSMTEFGANETSVCNFPERYIQVFDAERNSFAPKPPAEYRAAGAFEVSGPDSKILPSADANASQTSSNLLGDNDVFPGQFPSLVEVITKTSDKKFLYCAGTIIHSDIVITAAQCVVNDPLVITVRAGVVDVDRLENAQIVRAYSFCMSKSFREILKHETDSGKNQTSFRPTMDVALIWLSRKLVYNNYVQPVCVNFRATGHVGENFFFVGMGSSPSTSGLSQRAKYFPAVLGDKDCTEAFGIKDTIFEEYGKGPIRQRETGSATCFKPGKPDGTLILCKGFSGAPVYEVDQCEGGKWFNAMQLTAITSFKLTNTCSTDEQKWTMASHTTTLYNDLHTMFSRCFTGP